jgi:hypothetical protein
MATAEEAMTSVLKYARASERLLAMREPLTALMRMADLVLEIDVELGPEIEAIRERIAEASAHVVAAHTVLNAQLELVRDEL